MDRAFEEPVPAEDHNTAEAATPIYTRKAGSRTGVAEPFPPAVAHEESRAAAPWLPDETPGSPDSYRLPAGKFELPAVQHAADLPHATLKPRWVLLVFGFTLLFYWLF